MPTFTSGADTYTVSAAGTYDLDMLAGDDRLNVYGGTNVTAHMGLGDDLVILKAALNTIYGDAGLDRFDVYVADAVVDGGADNDTINVRANVNLLAHGGLGADRFNFYADALNVTLYGDDNDDDFYGYNHTISGSLYGGAGNDYFVQFGNHDSHAVTLYGGLGNDIYRADALNPATFVENALEGTDTVQVARGVSYTLPTNIENISVQGFSGSSTGNAATLTGNGLNNAIATHNNAETVSGLDGNDRLSAKGGDDTLDGGNGNDYLDGGTGNDTIAGGSGNDTLQGRSGNDVMTGGAGDDVYYVDSITDQVTENPGEGTDTVRLSGASPYVAPENVENIYVTTPSAMVNEVYGNNGDNIIGGSSSADSLSGLGGNDTIRGGGASDTLTGGNGDDLLQGGAGGDTLYGSAGADTLSGGDDSDILVGGTENDVINGGAGFDEIRGQEGADVLTGGSSNDNFYFTAVTDSALGAPDQITDFTSVSGPGGDILNFSGIDADTTVDGNQAFAGYTFTTPTAHSVWYTYVDNGDGTYEFTVYADVTGDTNPELQILIHVLSPGIFADDVVL